MDEFLTEQWFPVLLFSVSIAISYWFWKNPVEIALKKKRIIFDGDILYTTGIDQRNEWIVERVDTDAVGKNSPLKFLANRKNNPHVNVAPNKIEELRMLKYDEH